MGYIEEFRETVCGNISVYSNKNVFSYLCGSDVVNIKYESLKSYLVGIDAMLNKLSIVPGDRVAILSATTESFTALCMALLCAGVIAVPIDSNLPTTEKNRIIDFSDVKALFAESRLLEGICTENMHVISMERGLSFMELVFCDNIPNYEKTSDKVAAIVFSSGTTGTMKGVEITSKAVVTSMKLLEEYTGTTHKDVYLNVLPLSHVAGYLSAMASLWTGGLSVYIDEFNANSLMRAFEVFKPSLFEMVPEVFELMKTKTLGIINRKPLLKAYYKASTGIVGFCRRKLSFNPSFLTKPILSKMFGKNIRYIGGGAAPFSEGLIRFYLDLGAGFGNVYGSTETFFPVAAYNIKNQYEYKGVGNIDQFDNIEVMINNPDENGIGEIYVKTELIMNGYYKDPKLTVEAFDNGWFKTGDCGYIDEDRILYIKGRIKENIVLSNGEKITPAQLDDYYMMDKVKVACVGVMTKKGYDEVHMFAESGDEAVLDVIREKSKNAPKNYRVNQVHLIDKIPVTSIGKVKRFELRKVVTCENRN